jgi:hypothetical protein
VLATRLRRRQRAVYPQRDQPPGLYCPRRAFCALHCSLASDALLDAALTACVPVCALCAPQVTSPAELAAAPRLVFPGVGAFGAAMKVLKERGYVQPLRDYVQVRNPPPHAAPSRPLTDTSCPYCRLCARRAVARS